MPQAFAAFPCPPAFRLQNMNLRIIMYVLLIIIPWFYIRRNPFLSILIDGYTMFVFIDISPYFVYNYKHSGGIDMGRKSVSVLPQTEEILRQMGEQIKTARLRRHLSAELVAERAGVSRATVWNVEKGNPSVAIGIYAAVLHALNSMDKDFLLVAKDDELGRKLQDLELITKKRAPNRGGK